MLRIVLKESQICFILFFPMIMIINSLIELIYHKSPDVGYFYFAILATGYFTSQKLFHLSIYSTEISTLYIFSSLFLLYPAREKQGQQNGTQFLSLCSCIIIRVGLPSRCIRSPTLASYSFIQTVAQ